MTSNLKSTFLVSIFSAIAGVGSLSSPAHAEIRTKNFSINIQVNCEEGNVTCNNVTYIGRNLRTGKTIRLKGKTIHSYAADGITPGQFQGYEFRNKEYKYFVTADNKLLIFQNGKRIAIEQGREY
jgi:hypothetical protein